MTDQHTFDWSNLAFASKKPLKNLRAVFIAAPREISEKRFTQLVKELLPKTNVVLGIAKEPYVEGFEQQLQFKTLEQATVQKVLDKVNSSVSKNKIYTLTCFQRELPHIVEKAGFKKVLFVNGSWKYAFHNLPIFYTMVSSRIPYQLISPFYDEAEARQYEKSIKKSLNNHLTKELNVSSWSESGLMSLVSDVAKQSFDYNFQTGVLLAKKKSGGYNVLTTAHNKVVPYETYALHNGALRETNFSPPNDLNFYDTVHAEVELILAALRDKTNLKSTSLFINLLPCPTCARMLCDTDIAEVVYQNDHSDGYAIALLQKAGKKVRRIITKT